ncbi:MAG TPA: tetratricopeptide repeat protein [Chitinophagaceae bacterium]
MKQQLLLTSAGILLLISLLFFGSIESQKSSSHHTQLAPTSTFNITDSIQKAKQRLPASQLLYVANLENSITRGDVKQQSHNNLIHLANFWKDSAKSFVPYAYYISEASKLDNSEKSLTFAARLILDSMRREENDQIKAWESETAVVLFEKAIQLNPDNEDLKVDLGSCYVYGKGMIGNAAETMKGIQQLLSVVAKDSNNMKAQMILGIGGVISKQYDKAITRLNKVVAAEPGNLEAVSWLADTYAETGDKVSAIKWYEYSKKLVNNPEYSKEVNIRIKALQ